MLGDPRYPLDTPVYTNLQQASQRLASPAGFEPVFIITGATNVSNTTVETTLFSTGLGSLAFKKNVAENGYSITFDVNGRYRTKAAAPGTLRLRIYWRQKDGTDTVIGDTGAITLPAAVGLTGWQLQGMVTMLIPGTGVDGTCQLVAHLVGGGPALTPVGFFNWLFQAADLIVDNLNEATFDITAQFSVADATNVIESKIGFVAAGA